MPFGRYSNEAALIRVLFLLNFYSAMITADADLEALDCLVQCKEIRVAFLAKENAMEHNLHKQIITVARQNSCVAQQISGSMQQMERQQQTLTQLIKSVPNQLIDARYLNLMGNVLLALQNAVQLIWKICGNSVARN